MVRRPSYTGKTRGSIPRGPTSPQLLPLVSMRILIIDNGTRHLPALRRLFRNHDVTVWRHSRIQLTKANHYDALVLSGASRLSVLNHRPRFRKEAALVKTWRKPLLGICFGFELIAWVFGSTLTRMAEKKKGVFLIRVTRAHLAFGRAKRLRVHEAHRWVVNKLGRALDVLAVSHDGVEAVRHRTRPILAVQFHPELWSDERGAAFAEGFLRASALSRPRKS